MGLKILHSADWHLGDSFTRFPEGQRIALREQQRKIPALIGELVHREQCDLVLLSGDLTEGTPGPEWVRLLHRAFRDMAVPVMIAPGNHDFCQPGCIWLEEDWPENVHIFTGSLESLVLPELDCRVYGAGYESMDCPPLLEGFRAEGQERWCVAVLHADPVTRNSPYSPVTAAQVRDSALDYIALGHIHTAGSFHAGSTLCGWPGCPMGRGWDETGEKGIYLVTLEDTPEIQFLPLPGIRFYEHTVQADEDAIRALETVLPPTPTQDHYRVTVTGTAREEISRLSQHFPHIPNLQLRDETRPLRELWEDAGSDTLRGVYLQLLMESQHPQRDLAARLSLELLSGEEVALP